MVGVADRDLQGTELGQAFFFGAGSHPGEVFQALAEGGKEVGDEGFGLGLRFGREVTGGVDLADGVSENGGDEDISAEVAGALGGGAGEGMAEEMEAGIG